MMEHQRIAVLDFGGQYTHLIANRVRRLNVYSEILDPETPASKLKDFKGIILSGGPQSVYGEGAARYDKAIFELGIPMLGICYGHQLMQHVLGGTVEKGETREYGSAKVNILDTRGIFEGLSPVSSAWMSHFDAVKSLAPGFSITATTSDCPIAGVANHEKRLYGIQFHPEVTHTPEGMKVLDNFLNLCGVARDWSIQKFIDDEIASIQAKVGDKKVFLLVSGGVDSTVCFALLEKALGAERVYGMLVDTGLMRLDEAGRVKKALNAAGFKNLHVAEEKERFLQALAGVTEPEAKRKIIGDLFWQVKEDNAEKLGLNPAEWIMGQGTIYPDTIETGGTKNAHTIKTHHNRVDLMQEMIAAGKVIEPIAQLYKDEVRELGEKLGLPHDLVWRQPFPGPGLGVRILCTGQKDLRDVSDFSLLDKEIGDFIIREFGVQSVQVRVLNIRSVGVQGDERTYHHPAALFFPANEPVSRDWEKLGEISTAITNRFFEVNRVILALRGPTDGIVLHAADIDPERVELLQRVDEEVMKAITPFNEKYGIWQFPVVLLPCGTPDSGALRQSIVLRPIASTEAMTASFAKIDWEVLEKLTVCIAEEKHVSHVFYDLTNKPPGTIEWE